ncbi:MAG TPA: hypothetical protein PLH94_07185 [Fimbriimonadaceae bacterium]|nr:hypothetical protein [Fimbriimonadaceae bacterium]
MNSMSWAIVAAVLLFVAMNGAWHLGKRLRQQSLSGDRESISTIETAVFALFGLLMAFTYDSSANRFEERRNLIVEEATAIEVAALRIDVLEPTEREALRALLVQYIEVRNAYNRSLTSEGTSHLWWRRARVLQSQIWDLALKDLGSKEVTPGHLLVLPALNTAFDAAASRQTAMRTHTPFPILGLLLFLAILTAYLGGRSLRVSERSDGPYCFVYSIMVCLTLLVMFDLDHPRQGLIRLDYTDQLFMETRDTLRDTPQ